MQSGLGNTTQSFFLSPKASGPSGLTWGVGPVGYYPTNTDNLLGPDKWGLGPTFVVLVQPGGWTIGLLANQIWSVGGDNNEQNISSMFLQPFIVYTTKTHTSFRVNSESTYDWENGQWTVPFNLFVSQVFKIGKLPVKPSSACVTTPRHPTGGPRLGPPGGLHPSLPHRETRSPDSRGQDIRQIASNLRKQKQQE